MKLGFSGGGLLLRKFYSKKRESVKKENIDAIIIQKPMKMEKVRRKVRKDWYQCWSITEALWKNAGEELQDIQRDDVTVSRRLADNEVIYVWIDNGGVSLAIGLIT